MRHNTVSHLFWIAFALFVNRYSGPLIAMILFIMPTLSTYLIPALKPYRSLGNLLTLIVGLLCVSVMFFG